MPVLPVADANKDHVALVSLYVLQVLDEERLVGVLGEERRLERGIVPPEDLHLVLDAARLLEAEGDGAERQVRGRTGMVHHRGGHLPGLRDVHAPSPVGIFGVVHEPEPGLLPPPVRAREYDEPVVVERVVRHRDQRLVPAPVVPAEHPVRGALRAEHAEDALEVRRLGVLLPLPPADVEEARRGELLAVAHHDGLPSPQDRTHRLGRPHLAGLVEDDHVEGDRSRRDVLGDRERAHHEDGLDGLDRAPRLLHEGAHREVAALLLKLAPEDGELPAPTVPGEPLPVESGDVDPVGLELRPVELAELGGDPRMRLPIEPGERLPLPERRLEPRAVASVLEEVDEVAAGVGP